MWLRWPRQLGWFGGGHQILFTRPFVAGMWWFVAGGLLVEVVSSPVFLPRGIAHGCPSQRTNVLCLYILYIVHGICYWPRPYTAIDLYGCGPRVLGSFPCPGPRTMSRPPSLSLYCYSSLTPHSWVHRLRL